MAITDFSLLFTPDEVLVRGFRAIKGLPSVTSDDFCEKNVKKFQREFGTTPTVVACIWSDIATTEDLDLGINHSKDINEKGFKYLLIALHFLFAYPNNDGVLSTHFGTCKRLVEGEYKWKWIKALAKLKDLVTVWPEAEYNDPDGRKILGTVDGIDFKIRERSTANLNVDSKQYSHKHNHGALKYEIMMDAYKSKIVHLNGPFRGGEHDKNMFLDKLKRKIPDGKLIVADRVYRNGSVPGWNDVLSLPCLSDSKELNNFKARLRSRHEAVNGRLKKFKVLDDTYRHDPKKHEFAFTAVCVIVQYSMSYGHPIFDA
eukprot:scaffold7681_cov122-Cylindrotheca_fusiformis.AAC.3